VREELAFEVALPRLLGKCEESKLYGSFKICCARSDWGTGSVRSKFVKAFP
jgi:hypothetical protein